MKKLLKIVLIILVLVIIIFVGISAYLGYSMTRVDRVPVEGNPGLVGLSYEGVSFPSVDAKLTLHGWFIPNTYSRKVVIMVHGNGHNRMDPTIGTLDIASHLVKSGYNVLMFDLRGYGESDGNMVSGGYYEKQDLEGAVNYITERGFNRIGVLGFSLGAVTSLLAAAEDNDINSIVSDSSYADLTDIMKPEFTKRTRAPQFFLKPILYLIKVMYGVDFAAIKPIDCVEQITQAPIFFIHGEEDDTIPVEHANRLFQSSQNPKAQLWIVPGAGHTRSYITHPDEYMHRVIAFFDATLQ